VNRTGDIGIEGINVPVLLGHGFTLSGSEMRSRDGQVYTTIAFAHDQVAVALILEPSEIDTMIEKLKAMQLNITAINLAARQKATA
jgi:hypothetical protein